MSYLELEGLAWRREQKCSSCHHVPMMIWTQHEARRRGLKVNEAAVQEATAFMLAADDRANILNKLNVPPPNNDNPAMLGPLYAMMAFREYPAPPAAAPDGTVPRWTAYLRSKQQAGGFWLPHRGRPPNSPNDEESMTLTVLYTLGPEADDDAETKQTRMQAHQWLAANFKGITPQALCWSILAGYEEKSATAQLLERQNADGGWSQTKELPSDAQTTGHALYAMLSRRSVETDHPAAVKARDFLLKTQTPDGSWPMTSRPRADRPEEGPAKDLKPITYFATSWAVLALLQHLPAAH
ncbi:MAG: prenyltransferase/squalene oxidase repeat-containing protein [Planctomycetaceae bacterium]